MPARKSTPGDLGRRIAHHRKSLGLTYEGLAWRTDLDPGYLRYLETNPAAVTSGTLSLLAHALNVTSEELLGGDADRPPGRRSASAKPTLESLEPQECLRLISPGGVGRVAFNEMNGPTVLPVNYKMLGDAVVFRTRYGGAMDQELRTGLEGVEIKIGFQVDRIDDARSEGWSVLIQGPAHRITEDELAGMSGSAVDPWAGGERELYIRIIPHRVTGRRIHNM